MKVAYFSPFPPQKTGISAYSNCLVPELRKLMSVDCFDFNNPTPLDTKPVFENFSLQRRIAELGAYDVVFYNFGNNPFYHLWMFEILREHPGIVILHDTVLYYLFAGGGRAALLKHFISNYGFARRGEVDQIVKECPGEDILRFPSPARYPLVGSLFPYAQRIIVHNRAAQAQLRSLGYSSPIHVLAQLGSEGARLPNDEERRERILSKYSLSTADFIIGTFGFIGPTKRIDKLCQALGQVKREIPFKLLIVGEGENVRQFVSDNDLQSHTVVTGFVSDDDFLTLMTLVDVIVNLRYPSMGESSWTLTQALKLGKACVVTNDASFAELPNDCVVKVRYDSGEVDDLVSAMRELKDDRLRVALGKRGRRHADWKMDAGYVAQEFKVIAESEAALSRLDASAGDESSKVASKMLRDSLKVALPEFVSRELWHRCEP